MYRRGCAGSLAVRHPMKDSTGRTILKRLEEKGYVKRHVEGRTNVYRVTEPPRNLAVTAVKQIIDRLCGGSVEQLIVCPRSTVRHCRLRRSGRKRRGLAPGSLEFYQA
jgi:predicted transcriptional regulator